jgi:hypothetical protein
MIIYPEILMSVLDTSVLQIEEDFSLLVGKVGSNADVRKIIGYRVGERDVCMFDCTQVS